MHGGLFHAPAEQSGNIYRPAITRQITALGLLLRSADQTVPFLHFVPRSMFLVSDFSTEISSSLLHARMIPQFNDNNLRRNLSWILDAFATSTNCYEFILNKTLKLYYTTVKKIISITSSIYLNDEDRMKKCDTRKEERIVRSCIITEKKKIKNTRDVLSRTKSNWATYRKININLHVNVFDIARATYLIFSNNSACVINYPVQTHYPENTQITFPWTEFYSQTGRINYSPVSRDSKWLRR